MTDPRSGQAQSGSAEPSLGELFSSLASNTQNLIKQELALAKTELTQSAKEIGLAIAKLVAAALILYTGLIVLLFAAVALLHKSFSWWVSGLIVGGVVILLGLFLVLRARAQLSAANLKPSATMESLKDDAAWAKGQVQ